MIVRPESTTKRHGINLYASGVALLCFCSPAFAQSEAPAEQPAAQSAAAEAPQSESLGAGEIIVTASKRAESINKVGLTIAAVSGDQLVKQGISSVQDLTKAVPGLTYARSAFGTPVFTLRGVGYFDTALAASPAVSVYVDQAPLSFSALPGIGVGLDMERVEVLKGPQGILFGQNSTGGAINYIANKPTDTLTSGFSLGYGRFSTVEGEAFISGPVTDTLNIRLAGRSTYAGSWQKNYFSRPGDEFGKRREFAGRITLDWKPTDRLSFMASLSGWHDGSEPQIGQYIFLRPATAGQEQFLSPQLYNFETGTLVTPYAPRKARAADWSADAEPFRDDRMYNAALRTDYDVTDNLTLTSITSYSDYKRNSRAADDGTAVQDYDYVANDGYIRDFNQELRLSNDAASRMRVTVGANYQHSKVYELSKLSNGDSIVSNFSQIDGTSTLLPVPFSRASDFSRQTIENYAFFGNVDFDVTDTITVKGGLRYTNSKRHFVGCTFDNNFDPIHGDDAQRRLFDIIHTFARSLVGLGASTPLQPGDCTSAIDPLTDANGNPLIGVENGQRPDAFESILGDTNLNEDNLSWKVGVDFKPVAGSLFYANVTKGYKAGSFPTISAATVSQYRPVVQESVITYEAGFKQELFDRSVLLTGAGFYYDYRNKQLRGFFDQPPFGTVFALDNVPKSTVKGGELAIVWRPVDGLNLSGAVTYVDAKIKKYSGLNSDGVFTDFAGDRVPFAPKWNASANADYTVPLGASLAVNLGASLTYNSSTQAAIGHDAVTKAVTYIKPFTTVDARIALQDADNAWQVQFWVKNLTNEYYWNNVAFLYDTAVRYAAMPRTYGVKTSFRF